MHMEEPRTASVADLRRELADVLNDAVRGRTTIVTSRGRAIAAVVPLSAIEHNQDD